MKPANPPVSPNGEPLRVGLLGVGTVGAGTCRVLSRNRHLIGARAGRAIELRALSTRTLSRAHGVVGPDVALVADPMHLVRDPGIDVVVEAIGGCTTAHSLVLEAIAHGKHVVTANKALLALHGEEIFAAAQSRGVTVAYEGAVAVSIPIIKALREGLAANQVSWLAGIVNGTSNFILTKMRDAGLSFPEALKQAQQLGYAEADPTLDIGGFDAAHKLALLASLAFGMPLQFDKIAIEGISSVHNIDQRFAGHMGYEIKQLAVAWRKPHGVELRVHPALVSSSSLLSRIDGAMNGVLVSSDAAGLTMHCGAGAGSEQTASAVIADLIDLARLGHAAGRCAVPSLGVQSDALATLPVVPLDEVVTRNYLRIPLAEGHAASGVLEMFERQGIAANTHFEANGDSEHEGRQLVVMTPPVRDGLVGNLLPALRSQPAVRGDVVRLRVEDLPCE